MVVVACAGETPSGCWDRFWLDLRAGVPNVSQHAQASRELGGGRFRPEKPTNKQTHEKHFHGMVPKKYLPARYSGLPEFSPKIPGKYRKNTPKISKMRNSRGSVAGWGVLNPSIFWMFCFFCVPFSPPKKKQRINNFDPHTFLGQCQKVAYVYFWCLCPFLTTRITPPDELLCDVAATGDKRILL